MTVPFCPLQDEMVEARIDHIATQYRESPKLLFMIRTYIRQVEEAARVACVIPTLFDIDDAVGEQLTFLGRRMGWGRCHCVCDVEAAFGFECEGFPPKTPVLGFCEQVTWSDCRDAGIAEVCINEDEMYRRFLKARRYQLLGLYDRESLTIALRHLYGDQALIIAERPRRIVLAPRRVLTQAEMAVIQLVPRVLPIAYGVQVRFHFGLRKPFGFGEGWAGFCEPFEAEGQFLLEGIPLATEDGTLLVTEDGVEITTGVLHRGGEWICEIDVRPYDCL